MKVDSAGSSRDLVRTWIASGRVFAETDGSLVALISLMVNAPIHIASFRGAIAFAVVRGVMALGSWLLPRVLGPADTEAADEQPENGPEAFDS